MAVKTPRAGRGHGFAQVLEWSSYKHLLLKKYLHVFCYKLGSSYPELAFVDTCAGAGKYDDGADGSPLIAAKYNDNVGMIDRSGLTVYAFETDPEVYPKLVANLAPFAARKPPRAFTFSTSFFDNPQLVLDATRRVPTLFFIDDYGTNANTTDSLGPVLTDTPRAPTELLVRMDPTMLARYAGWVFRQKHSDEPIRCAAGFTRLLERLNIDTGRITDDRSIPPDKYELFHQHLKLYREHFRYVQTVPVRADYWAAPKYMLIHATNNAHGAAHLNDNVSTIEDSLFTKTEERKDAALGVLNLFAPERLPRYSQSDLDEQTWAFIKEMGDTEFINLRAELADAFGPDFREKHHRAAVKRLIAAGHVEVVRGDPKIDSSTILRIKR